MENSHPGSVCFFLSRPSFLLVVKTTGVLKHTVLETSPRGLLWSDQVCWEKCGASQLCARRYLTSSPATEILKLDDLGIKKDPPTAAHEGFMVYTDPLHFFLFGDPGGECHPGWGRRTPKWYPIRRWWIFFGFSSRLWEFIFLISAQNLLVGSEPWWTLGWKLCT